MLQDKKGFIWIATDNGLCRYDGVHYKSYVCDGMSSKAGSYIREDLKGRVWYANFDGNLFYVEDDTLKPFGIKQNIATHFAIIENALWIIHDSSLQSFDIQTGKMTREVHVAPARALYQSGHTLELIDYNGSQMRLADNKGNIMQYINISNRQLFKALLYQNSYYFVTQYGMEISVEKLENEHYDRIFAFKNKAQLNGAGIDGNVIWFATKSGLMMYNIITNQTETLRENEIVSYSMVDRLGNRWICTMNGIYIYPRSGHQFVNPIPSVNCRLLSYNQHLYLYDNNGVVSFFDVVRKKYSTLYQDPNKQSIYQIYISPRADKSFDFEKTNRPNFSSTFFFQDKKIVVFKPGFKEYTFVGNKYAAIAITGACELIQNPEEQSGSIWDSLAKHYIYVSGADEDIRYVSVFYAGVRVKSVAYDTVNKIIYYATNDGVKAVSPSGPGEIRINETPIFADKIICSDSKVLLLENNGQLILRTNLGSPVRLNHLRSLFPVLQIKKLYDHLVIWNKQHIYLIPIASFNEKTQVSDFKIPDIFLNTSEINDVEWIDSTFYISTAKQLIECRMKNTRSGDFIPPFYINEIITHHHRFSPEGRIVLKSNENDISISFSVLSYFKEPIEISYQLNNDIWKKIEPGQRKLEFISLSPGKYLLKFKINGRVQDTSASFTILRPWYLQIWFLGTCLVIVIVTVGFYFRKRMRRQQAENMLLLEKTNLEKDLRQSMLSSIKSQMNPHFLFNALNTIQSYIITEDKINASNYLSKFSKLTRKILEMSDKETISLQEEIDALLLYIELEKMRFPELNYTIEIDKNVDTHHIFIPSMIIQPYVENAIKHGLLHKKGDKQLFIGITKIKEFLMIQIEDNGIGRKQSANINQNKNETHRSFASHANMKRIELLNIEKNEIGIEYTDKENEAGESSGTVINIKIPIKNIQ